jgi:oligoendopeptidase F
MIDETIRSIPTQLRYTRFEERAHQMILDGCAASDLDALWTSMQKEDFPMVAFADSSVQWRSIPHIYHSPFYCYSYAFGQLLVFALWKKYEDEGPAFTPKLREILASGGSVPPAELLARYGFDITSEAFWDGGFAAIKGLIEELEKVA